MNAPDYLAGHPGLLTPGTAFDLIDEWARTDADGQAWAWRTAHPDKYREDPLLVHKRRRLAAIRREDAEAFANVR